MSQKQLPPQASFGQLRKQAKDLFKAYRARSPEATARVRESLPRLDGKSDAEVIEAACSLQDIQHVLAVEYGFENWGQLRRTVESSSGDPLTDTQTAARGGDREALERLLAADPSLVNRRSEPDGGTLLSAAAIGDQGEIVTMLIDAGAEIEATSGEGWRALHSAAGCGCHQSVGALLDAGADLTAEACGSGGTPLVHALFHGDDEMADLLAVHSMEPANLRVAAGLGRIDLIHKLVAEDGTLSPEAGLGRGFYRHHTEYPPWSPTDDPQEILDEALVYAAHNGRLEAVDVLVERGANINGMPYYATALHQAVIRGDRTMVKHLLSRGADPSIRDEMHGGCSYEWARYSPSPDLSDLLLEAAAKTDLRAAVKLGLADRAAELAETASAETLVSGFQAAVRQAETDIAKLLRERGAEPSLFDLIELGLADEVAEALSQGADPNVTRERLIERMGDGLVTVTETALQVAESGKWPEIGRLLEEAGAEVDLHGAAFLNRIDLINGGTADEIDATDVFGMTPLHRAIQGAAEAAVKHLLSLGASVEMSSDSYTFGGRAIHVAASTDASPKIIALLIEAGADVNDKRNPGTPLEVAEREGQERTGEVLRAKGAVG